MNLGYILGVEFDWSTKCQPELAHKNLAMD